MAFGLLRMLCFGVALQPDLAHSCGVADRGMSLRLSHTMFNGTGLILINGAHA